MSSYSARFEQAVGTHSGGRQPVRRIASGMASRQAEWQKKRRRKGLCTRCGKPRPKELSTLCIECAVKRREQRRKRAGSKSHYENSKTYRLAS